MTTTRDAYRETLAALAAKAKAALPGLNGRVESAVKLVLAGDVELRPDGTARVGSGSDPAQGYQVGVSCPCQDYPRAEKGLCKHRLSAIFALRLSQLLPEDAHEAIALDQLADETGSAQAQGPEEAPMPLPSVPAEYVVWIQGKPFVRFAGLLKMAHESHLVELQEHWTYNDSELSLAHAVAIFEDGRRFEGSGDATRDNVTKKVAPHFRRVALTRAKSRALRDALNCDMVAVEELGDE